jgi:D-alanyl-D-alanine carboxypeptidase
MKTNILLFLTLLSVIISSCKRDIDKTVSINCDNIYTNDTHPRRVAYQEVIDKYIKKGLPGISVLIQDSDGVWSSSAGFADLERQIPFTHCHI